MKGEDGRFKKRSYSALRRAGNVEIYLHKVSVYVEIKAAAGMYQ